jgi:hypothetical protein
VKLQSKSRAPIRAELTKRQEKIYLFWFVLRSGVGATEKVNGHLLESIYLRRMTTRAEIAEEIIHSLIFARQRERDLDLSSATFEILEENAQRRPANFEYLASIGLMDKLTHHELYNLLVSVRDDNNAFLRVWNWIKPSDRIESLIHMCADCASHDNDDDHYDSFLRDDYVTKFKPWRAYCIELPDDHPFVQMILSAREIARQCIVAALGQDLWFIPCLILSRVSPFWIDMDFLRKRVAPWGDLYLLSNKHRRARNISREH